MRFGFVEADKTFSRISPLSLPPSTIQWVQDNSYPGESYSQVKVKSAKTRFKASSIMPDIRRQEIFVRGKPTELLSLGPSLKEKPKKVILIIPGNPGVSSYYKDFMRSIHEDVGTTHSVCTISHAGHAATSSLNFWPSGQHIYNLEDQIQHKIAFIIDNIPKETQITLVGHSIGSYLILRVLKALENHPDMNINKNYLLFPTVERMKTSENGQKLWPILCYLRWLVVFLALVVSILPNAIKRFCVSLYFRKKNVPKSSIDATVELLHPKIVQNVLWMAYHELSELGGADVDIIERHKNKLVFYYGATDGWCPQSYRNELLLKVNGLETYLCDRGFPHAFVLGNAQGMAKIVSSWIRS